MTDEVVDGTAEEEPRDPFRDGGDHWRELWEAGGPFPILSHRPGLVGRLIVFFKRLFSPLGGLVSADLVAQLEQQREFNLFLVHALQDLQVHQRLLDLGRNLSALRVDLRSVDGDLKQVQKELVTDLAGHHERLAHLEGYRDRGLADVMLHNDALFSRVDQKLDAYRRDAHSLAGKLGAVLAVAGKDEAPVLSHAWSEISYLALEERHRGTEEEIRERLRWYLPHLAGRGEVLDLGCGRGEGLEVLREERVPARGVDESAQMVAHCKEKGLQVEKGDVFDFLASLKEESLGAVISFHVVEHLPGPSLERLLRLIWRVVKPGGKVILETPNPLSLVVAAQSFWRDPSHQRPVHPETLKLLSQQAGFENVEIVQFRPFSGGERLPEISLDELSPELKTLADRWNRIRDRLDELLYGYQDYALIGTRSGT